MHIVPIGVKNYQITNLKNNNSQELNQNPRKATNLNGLQKFFYGPSFGYCEPHMRLMKTLNSKFADAIIAAFSEYENAKSEINSYLTKLKIGDEAHKTATQIIAQYANYQYSMAEVIPSYAMESSPEVAAALSKVRIFSNPIDIMLNIGNIPSLESKTSIDKNTGAPYTKEQMQKSRANTQLYSTVMLLEMFDRSMYTSDLTPEVKVMVLDLRKLVLGAIARIYGEDAFDRIQKLKEMGLNASVEDKRKSLELVKEFDRKAQELSFSEDFDKKLKELIEHINASENRTEESQIKMSISPPVVALQYHTHPQDSMPHSTHSHDYMHEHGIAHTHKEPVTELE